MSPATRAPRRAISASVGGGSVTIPVRNASRSCRSTGSTPPRHALLALQLAQHVLSAFEVPAEDLARYVEQLPDRRVAHGIPHGQAVLARLDDVLRAEPS